MPRIYKFLSIEDYVVSKNGTVTNKHTGNVVKPQKNGKGYLRVSIGGKLQFVHRLVATAYVQNPENKPCVNHKDGDKTNNCAENLEWVTNHENSIHASESGLLKKEQRHPFAKLTRQQVSFIKAHDEISSGELAKLFGVTRSTINAIRKGKTWKTVEKIC